jgi:hypothetical protein
MIPVMLIGTSITMAISRPPASEASRASIAPAYGLTKNFSGQITAVQAEKLVVVNAVGEDHTFPISDDTMVMVNDVEASVDKLQAGQMAMVQAESRGGQWIAMSIHATQQY